MHKSCTNSWLNRANFESIRRREVALSCNQILNTGLHRRGVRHKGRDSISGETLAEEGLMSIGS